MDELHGKLMGELDEVRSSVSDIEPKTLAQVRRGARRRRQVRAIGAGAASVLVIGAIGVGAWGLAGVDRADGLQPMVSDTPTPIDTPVPQITAGGTAVPAPTHSADGVTVTGGPPLDDSPDGIPEDGYPELAADRNNAKTAASDITYPRAHVIKDWVWDRVGPGWALDTASAQLNVYEDGWEQPPAVVYLVSPENRYFEVAELPKRAWNDARVVTWRENLDTAMVWWGAGAEDRGSGGFGGAIDLRTGALDDLVMAVNGKTAKGYRFIAANAQGDELWRAESDNGFKYYRWRQGADEDGWVASALVNGAPSADAASFTIGRERPTTTANADVVLLRPADEVSDTATVVTLVTYTLSSDTFQTHTFPGVPAGSVLQNALFIGKNTIEADLHYPKNPGALDHTYTFHRVQFSLGGSGGMTRVAEGEETFDTWHERAMVGYGEATDPSVATEDCGC